MADIAHTYRMDSATGELRQTMCGIDGPRTGAVVCGDCRSAHPVADDALILTYMDEFGAWLVDQPLARFHQLTSRELLIDFLGESPSWKPIKPTWNLEAWEDRTDG